MADSNFAWRACHRTMMQENNRNQMDSQAQHPVRLVQCSICQGYRPDNITCDHSELAEQLPRLLLAKPDENSGNG